jgi:hypothetical protein
MITKAKFPKEIFVWLDERTGGFNIEASDSLDGAAYGLSPGDDILIGRYVLAEGEPGHYASKLHYVPKGAKVK